jgi:hypothetical protein
LLKLLVKEAKKLRRRPVDEESLLIAGLDTERVWFTPVHHPKKLRLRFVSAEARRLPRVLAFYHSVFWRVFKQGRDGVIDDSNDILEMLLAVCDVLVEMRTLGVVSLEELRENTRVRVDHIDVGVAVVRESLSDVELEPLYGRRAPLGIQASPALLWIEGEVNLVRVSIMLFQTFTKPLELRELPGFQAFRFDDACGRDFLCL